MTSPVLDFIRADSVAEVATLVAESRAAGKVPLVGDQRWSMQHWQTVCQRWSEEKLFEDTAWAALSSGTTGNPRLILRTAQSWQNSFEILNNILRATADDVFYIPGSPASSLALFTIAHAAKLGASVVGDESFEQATIFHGTPSLLRSTLARLAAGQSSKLRVALVGGDALDAATREIAAAHSISVISYYGAAELSLVAIDVDGSGLKPFAGVEIKIIDGQLWVKSPYRAIGYLGDGGALQESADGFATVGDLASFEDGCLKIQGRADGAIQTAGVTVIPEEVEKALQTLPGVDQVVVFGLPSESIANLVAAVITFNAHAPSEANELRTIEKLASELLSHTHRPRVWFVAESLPTTVSAKPARKQIQAAAIAGEYRKLV